MEHEYYNGLSFAILIIVGVKKLGPKLAAFCDKEIDRIEAEWSEGRNAQIRQFEEGIEDEKKSQWSAEGQSLLLQAKKENIGLQLEATYRERLMTVYNEVINSKNLSGQLKKYQKYFFYRSSAAWITSLKSKMFTDVSSRSTWLIGWSIMC